MTAAIQRKIADGLMTKAELNNGISKFSIANFGQLSEIDKEFQDNLIAENEVDYEYMGVYFFNGLKEKFWIMNGIDKDCGKYSMIMLPEDY